MAKTCSQEGSKGVGVEKIVISLNQQKDDYHHRVSFADEKPEDNEMATIEEKKLLSDLSKRNWGHRSAKKRNLMMTQRRVTTVENEYQMYNPGYKDRLCEHFQKKRNQFVYGSVTSTQR